MKKLLAIVMCLALGTMFLVGCGKKEGTKTNSAAGQPEEMADTTRMDSAMMNDTMHQGMGDTTGAMMKDTGTMEGGH